MTQQLCIRYSLSLYSSQKYFLNFTASWHLTHACYATACAFQILASFSFLVFSTDPYFLKEIQVTYNVRQYARDVIMWK